MDHSGNGLKLLNVKRSKSILPRKEPDPKDGKEGLPAFLTPEEMHTLSRLVLQSRYVVEGNLAGAHRSPLRGSSSEFSDHKAYGVGDDPKHIDWRVLGRTGKYYIKRFEDETNLRVYMVLDRSHSMGYGSEDQTKFEYACRLLAAFGYVTVKAKDSVGLFLHAEKIDAAMDARNSLNHLNNMLKHIQTFEPGDKTEVAEALHQIAGTVRHRALIVILSDLIDEEQEIIKALAHFRKRHHDVIVLHTLDPMELDFGFKKNCKIEDLETKDRIMVDPRRMRKAYTEVFGAFLDTYRKACAGMKIDYRVARTDQPLDRFVRAYLEERNRLSK
jgi:uncharacterized protein (DUF58 family)